MIKIIGTIPACVGEPVNIHHPKYWTGDYPRVCGGTDPPHFCLDIYEGLSPRVRGNHIDKDSRGGNEGTIPACAGEPFRCSSYSAIGKDYPRVCGGTFSPSTMQTFGSGLSPRVRGNLNTGFHLNRVMRTIPACAGEPA